MSLKWLDMQLEVSLQIQTRIIDCIGVSTNEVAEHNQVPGKQLEKDTGL